MPWQPSTAWTRFGHARGCTGQVRHTEVSSRSASDDPGTYAGPRQTPVLRSMQQVAAVPAAINLRLFAACLRRQTGNSHSEIGGSVLGRWQEWPRANSVRAHEPI
jgi:hypothetical protein